MMLSKRMTAKSRELKPANQARKRMVKDRRDCHPAGWVKPPDRPPPPPHGPGVLARPFPDNEPLELGLALCLQSEVARCSAMFCRGVSDSKSFLTSHNSHSHTHVLLLGALFFPLSSKCSFSVGPGRHVFLLKI